MPQTADLRRRRTEVLDRALTDPSARSLIDSGQLAEPYWYTDEPADHARTVTGRLPGRAWRAPPAGTRRALPRRARAWTLARRPGCAACSAGRSCCSPRERRPRPAARRRPRPPSPAPVTAYALDDIDHAGVLGPALARHAGQRARGQARRPSRRRAARRSPRPAWRARCGEPRRGAWRRQPAPVCWARARAGRLARAGSRRLGGGQVGVQRPVGGSWRQRRRGQVEGGRQGRAAGRAARAAAAPGPRRQARRPARSGRRRPRRWWPGPTGWRSRRAPRRRATARRCPARPGRPAGGCRRSPSAPRTPGS